MIPMETSSSFAIDERTPAADVAVVTDGSIGTVHCEPHRSRFRSVLEEIRSLGAWLFVENRLVIDLVQDVHGARRSGNDGGYAPAT